MRLLILSVSIGNGHLKAAEAIRTYCEEHYDDIKVKEVDYLKYINPVVDKVIVGSYLSTLKLLPILYGKLYSESKEDNLKKIVEVFNKVCISKTRELVNDFGPDVILCTHPFPLEAVSVLKKRNEIDIPSAAIITDYTIHPKWIYENIDAYVVPNEDFIIDMTLKGILKEKVYPLGIPVCEKFFYINEEDKDLMIKELGFSKDKPIVMMMGGGLGIGNISRIFKDLISSKLEFQIIVCGGNNKKLIYELMNIYNKIGKKKKAVIIGYTNKINVIMSISDVIITKPGGLTITEAMHMRLPIIINSPIPGQEDENAEYLLNCGIGLSTKYKDVNYLLNQILFNENTKRIEYIHAMETEKVKQNSNKSICELLISLYNHRMYKLYKSNIV